MNLLNSEFSRKGPRRGLIMKNLDSTLKIKLEHIILSRISDVIRNDENEIFNYNL